MLFHGWWTVFHLIFLMMWTLLVMLLPFLVVVVVAVVQLTNITTENRVTCTNIASCGSMATVDQLILVEQPNGRSIQTWCLSIQRSIAGLRMHSAPPNSKWHEVATWRDYKNNRHFFPFRSSNLWHQPFGLAEQVPQGTTTSMMAAIAGVQWLIVENLTITTKQ